MITKKYKIGICGGYDNSIKNGQALRTMSITEQVRRLVGDENLLIVKYAEWKKNPFKLLFDYIKQIKECKVVLLCPDERAIRFMIPIAKIFGGIYKTKVYYVVIGGWLPVFLKKHKIINYELKKISGLFVQTEVLKKQLAECKVEKVNILPNFRVYDFKLDVSKDKKEEDVLKTFFLSRIEEPKGVTEMIETVKRVNEAGKKCTLDIFGSVMGEYKETFDKLCDGFPSYIRYTGELESNEINGVIKNYDLQLFPTKYKTEGFPGAILDSYYAGVPVLSAEWNSGREIVKDYVDGVLFRQFDYDDMKQKLEELIEDNELVNKLKSGSRKRGMLYDSETIIKNMLEVIGVEITQGDKNVNL